MTKYEAKKLVLHNLAFGEVDGRSFIDDDNVLILIDKIYDDFESQLLERDKEESELLTIAYMQGGDAMKKHFESRTCSSCRWYKEIYNERSCASQNIHVCKLWDIAFTPDMGCNKYEPKEKKDGL